MNTHDHKAIQRIKRHRAATVAKIIAGALNRYRKKDFDGMYDLICNEFLKLGGVYVKFLQGVLLRSEFMKRWKSEDRLSIFENLETEPIDIQAFLQRELKPEALRKIASINPVPFAAGSFGQVYYGQHVDGTQIIVKVLRPLIRETLKFDLRLLGMFMRQFSKKLYTNVSIDLKKPIEDFKLATLRETDYIGEAKFAAEMYENYKDNDKFVIPRSYVDLCTKNMLTQEYIGGISVADVVKAHEQTGTPPEEYVKYYTGSDISTQLETLGYEYIMGIFYLPRVQGDPHPGNIKLLPGNKVGLIDFGIYAMTPKEKPALYGLINEYYNIYNDHIDVAAMFGQFMRFFSNELYTALDRINRLLPTDKQSDNLAHEIGTVAAEGFKQTANKGRSPENMIADGSILTTTNKLTNKDNRFGLVLKVEDVDMLRAAQTYITLVESLGQGAVLKQVFKRSIDDIAKRSPEYTYDEVNPMSVGRAIEVISRWLERVAERDPHLFGILSEKIRSQEKEASELSVTIEKELKND